jgi:hypothetical protein
MEFNVVRKQNFVKNVERFNEIQNLSVTLSNTQKTKPPPFLMRVCFSGGPTRT